jgi:hypothetical protein
VILVFRDVHRDIMAVVQDLRKEVDFDGNSIVTSVLLMVLLTVLLKVE